MTTLYRLLWQANDCRYEILMSPLRIILFLVDRPCDFILRPYRTHFSSNFQTIYTILRKMVSRFSRNKNISEKQKRIPGRPDDLFVSHLVDKKQNYFLVLPQLPSPFLHKPETFSWDLWCFCSTERPPIAGSRSYSQH